MKQLLYVDAQWEVAGFASEESNIGSGSMSEACLAVLYINRLHLQFEMDISRL
jgi:hypothetical protein